MKLWLDDIRKTPDGWVRAHSVHEAIELIELAGEAFEFASLDHDLGEFEPDGGDGWRLTRWMLASGQWPKRGINFHSSNITGIENMLADVDDADPYGEHLRLRRSLKLYRGEAPEGDWPVPGHY